MRFRPFVLLCLLALALPAGAVSASRDRDRDRMPDRWERTHKLKVGQRDGAKDPDRDGLSNRLEYRARTHPRRADTDRDGIKDGAERRCGTDPRRKTRRGACGPAAVIDEEDTIEAEAEAEDALTDDLPLGFDFTDTDPDGAQEPGEGGDAPTGAS